MAVEPEGQQFWTRIFLELVALVCVFEWGDSWRAHDWLPGTVWLVLGVAISVIGFKWPQIKRRWDRRWSIAILVILVAGGIAYGVLRYHSRHQPARLTLAAPTGFMGGISTGSIPVTMSKGRLIRVPPSERPCSIATSSYGQDGLEGLPGGPNLKRPRLLIDARNFSITAWSTPPPRFDDLFFQVDLTNRGESSIAKDWRLCLIHGKEALYFDAQIVDPSQGLDLSQSTFSNSVEHGHSARGWLRFHVPQEDVDASLSGSLQCKDYLEHTYQFLFAADKNQKAN